MISTNHLHPMIVHFPIALVMFGFIAELGTLFFKKEICLTKAGFYLLIAGTLSALAAITAGILFTSEMSGAAGEVEEIHEIFAFVTVVLLVTTSIMRLLLIKKPENLKLKWAALVFYGLAALSVSLTGFFGGTLVYNYMMPL
jgi:uncharacterized membrane protein